VGDAVSHSDDHLTAISQAQDEAAARTAHQAALDHLQADVPPAGAAPPQQDLRRRALNFLRHQYDATLAVRLRELAE
jgi:hypothetical protein